MTRIREIEEELKGLKGFLDKSRRREEGLNTNVDVGIRGGVLCRRNFCRRRLGILLDNIF